LLVCECFNLVFPKLQITTLKMGLEWREEKRKFIKIVNLWDFE